MDLLRGIFTEVLPYVETMAILCALIERHQWTPKVCQQNDAICVLDHHISCSHLSNLVGYVLFCRGLIALKRGSLPYSQKLPNTLASVSGFSPISISLCQASAIINTTEITIIVTPHFFHQTSHHGPKTSGHSTPLLRASKPPAHPLTSSPRSRISSSFPTEYLALIPIFSSTSHSVPMSCISSHFRCLPFSPQSRIFCFNSQGAFMR